MVRLTMLDWIALILVIIGGINWGLIGAANVDLVAFAFGPLSTPAKVIYILVGIAAVYLAVTVTKNYLNRTTI